MNTEIYQVRGLCNLGNTCFLNCILQALAPSSHLKSYLRQAVCAFGPDAPDVAVALLESLEDLTPIPSARCCPPVSPGPLLSALRQHVRADVLIDWEQNDAVEALEVLLGTLVSQLQSAFQHGRGPELTSLSAWHAISGGPEHQALVSTYLPAAKSAPCPDLARGSSSQQGRSIEHSAAVENGNSHPETAPERSMKSRPGTMSKLTPDWQASSEDPHRLVLLHLNVAEDGLTVTATLAVTASGTMNGAATFGIADEKGQTEAMSSADAQSSKTSATAEAECVSCSSQHYMVPQHAPEQTRRPPADPMLQAWRALSQLPLELALQHEAACARCRRPCASHVSAMLAVPLTLPTAEGPWGPVLKPGTTLHHALATYFSRDLVQDAVCTHCSLRATLEQAPPAINVHSATQPSAHLPAHANGPTKIMDIPFATISSTSQSVTEGQENADACLFHAARGSDNSSCEGLLRGGRIEGAAEKLARLRGLLRGSCALPDCDYVQLAADVGLPWSERRAPLLTRTVLARSPQVLCLQLRRVLWSRRGRLAKVPGRVAFPEELNLAPYTAAAAEPLLPVARPLVSHPLASLSLSHHAPAQAHASMRGRGLQDHTAAAAIAAPSKTGTCSCARRTNDNLSAVPVRDERKCSCSTGVGSADGGDLASAAAEVVNLQPGAAVGLRRKPERGAAMLYRLAAVIVHHGGAQSGHYTVYRKALVRAEPVDRALDNAFVVQVRFESYAVSSGASTVPSKSSWVHASDEDVRTATLAEVLSSEAAVLLYERAPQ